MACPRGWGRCGIDQPRRQRGVWYRRQGEGNDGLAASFVVDAHDRLELVQHGLALGGGERFGAVHRPLGLQCIDGSSYGVTAMAAYRFDTLADMTVHRHHCRYRRCGNRPPDCVRRRVLGTVARGSGLPGWNPVGQSPGAVGRWYTIASGRASAWPSHCIPSPDGPGPLKRQEKSGYTKKADRMKVSPDVWMVARDRIELPTRGFSIPCSTN